MAPPAGTTAGTTPGTGTDTTAAAAGAPTKGGILRVGTLGGANDLIDGQHIVSKADIARILAGWEPLLNFDPDYNIVNTDSLAEEVETKAADLYVVRLQGRPAVPRRQAGHRRRRDLLVHPHARPRPRRVRRLGPAPDPRRVGPHEDRRPHGARSSSSNSWRRSHEALCAYTTCIVPVGYERFAGDPTNQIGTGPYKLQEFEVGVQSIHVRNENYWDTGKPYFDEVHIIDFADGDAMINALVADQIDCAGDIPSSAVDVLNGTDGYKVLNSEGGGWLTIVMAVDQEPFTDVRVRQAMRLIVDRQAMVDQVLGGLRPHRQRPVRPARPGLHR